MMAILQFVFSRRAARASALMALVGAAAPFAGQAAEERAGQAVISDSQGIMNSINRGSLRAGLWPIQDIHLSSRAAGIIERYLAEEGQSVHAGDAIMVLDSNQEKAEVAVAEAVLRGAQAELDHARQDLDRAKPLSQEKIFSDKQFADAKYTFEVAQNRVMQAEASLSLAQSRLSNRTIASTIDGIFLKKTKNVGEAVDRFETVARIVDITAVKMEVYVDGSLFDSLKGAQAVRVQVFKSQDNYVTVEGKVTFIDPIIDPMSGTFRVRVELTPSADVIPGYSAILLLQPLQGEQLGKR
jgi:RND family efflux transporter MFP subunit